MYWLRDINLLGILPWFFTALFWLIGGWLISTHAFRLERRERILVGVSLGLALYVWFINLWGRFLPPEICFILAGVTVFALGVGFAWRGVRPVLDWRDLTAWQYFLVGVLLVLLFARIGKGTTLFDEHKNLSLISTMAAGDIPPHFYMNSTFYFAYHYGFQLIGASLMRLAGLLPWSAYDLSKAIVGALSVMLAYLVGARFTQKWLGGLTLATAITFATGTRYLLLLVPSSWLSRLSILAEMFPGENLSKALLSTSNPERLDHPVQFTFAFLNGIQSWPLFLGLQAGPSTLAILLIFMIWLTYQRQSRPMTVAILAIIFSLLALSWESTYLLFFTGGILATGLNLLRNRSFRLLSAIELALLISLPIAILQGGTVTEMIRSQLLSFTSRAGVESGIGIAGFTLRLPIAFVSSDFGQLPLNRLDGWVLALVELGPVIWLTPWITVWSWKKFRQGDWLQGAFLFSAWIGFIFPIFLRYKVDNDITRLTAYSLDLWTLLLVLYVFSLKWRENRFLVIFGAVILVLSIFGGFMIAKISLGYLNYSTIGTTIDEMDTFISRQFWDKLEPGSEIFDSRKWRATALTGRLSRSSLSTRVSNPVWRSLEDSPDVAELLEQGYRYVYVDQRWWRSLNLENQKSLTQPCVQVLASFENQRRFRKLLDLQGCNP